MITGVTAVAPSGDGAPMRIALSSAAQSSSTSSGQTASASSVAVARPESSSAGSSAQNQQQQSQRRDGGGDTAATGAYLASLLAASITGRAPEGPRPSRITPERLSMLISYLEATVSSTAPDRSQEEHAVDVKS